MATTFFEPRESTDSWSGCAGYLTDALSHREHRLLMVTLLWIANGAVGRTRTIGRWQSTVAGPTAHVTDDTRWRARSHCQQAWFYRAEFSVGIEDPEPNGEPTGTGETANGGTRVPHRRRSQIYVTREIIDRLPASVDLMIERGEYGELARDVGRDVRRLVDIARRDLCTFAGERERGRATDAAARAGDDDELHAAAGIVMWCAANQRAASPSLWIWLG
jgi:hypothetical protein